MNEEENPRPIRAGAAYLAATQNDPQSREAWIKLRLMAQGMVWVGETIGESLPMMRSVFDVLDEWFRPELADLEAKRQQAFDDLDEAWEEFRREQEAIQTHLRDLGFEITWQSIESWEKLARIVEKDPGPMTAREIYEWAIAWAEREAFRLRLTKKLDAEGTASKQPTVEDLVLIREDPHDPSVALVDSKRVYLGHETVVSKLFWTLAGSVGKKCELGEIQRAIDGFETFRDMGDEEYGR
jgi:hypothetical protein